MNVTNITFERQEKSKVKFTIEVPPESFEESLSYSYKKNAKRFSVPGFRKGKAPRSYVERLYGPEALYEDALAYIADECYPDALKAHDCHPVEKPELDFDTITKGEPLIFTLTVTVRPDVTLGEYVGVKAPYVVEAITEDDVDEAVKKIASSRARLIPVEDRPAQKGDTVIIDYAGFIDGKAFDGGTAESQSLDLGSGRFIPGFEDQIEGKSVGETFTVKTTFPESYHAAQLSGKPAEFKVTLQSVKQKEIPEIDDEFAKDVSEFDTLEEYRKHTREHLADIAKKKADEEFEDAVIAKVVESAKTELPEVMIENAIEREVEDFVMRLRMSGINNAEEYMRNQGETIESLTEKLRPGAERRTRMSLVINAVAKAESIEVTDDDVEKDLRERAERYRKEYDEYVQTVDDDMRERIRDRLFGPKVIAFLVDNAVKEA